jgi:hypothetical protein
LNGSADLENINLSLCRKAFAGEDFLEIPKIGPPQDYNTVPVFCASLLARGFDRHIHTGGSICHPQLPEFFPGLRCFSGRASLEFPRVFVVRLALFVMLYYCSAPHLICKDDRVVIRAPAWLPACAIWIFDFGIS